MAEDDIWRKRFLLFMGARLFGLLTFFLGLAIVFTDLLRPGGWPAIGAAIAVLGVIDAVGAPMLLRKHWKKEDRNTE